jgi:hypothetical protein
MQEMVTPTVRQPLVPITLGDLAHEEI